MAIFNSLGSNYSWSFVWQSLLGGPGSHQKLAAALEKRFGGQATLTYKGRDALELAFQRSGLPAGSTVAINGFTCYVVYQAIVNAGYQPVLIDVPPQQLNFDLKGLKKTHQLHPDLKAVVVQNTLGVAAEVPAIAKYCRQNNLLMVEDLAHSLGLIYDDGRAAGTVGDLTMLSFSQDKPLDVVAGGALLDRRSKPTTENFSSTKVSTCQRAINRSFPFWTGLIRGLYPVGLGRYLHAVLKRLHWLATPMSDNIQGLHTMSSAAARLLLRRLKNIDSEVAHRQKITAIYQKGIASKLQLVTDKDAACLRFPIWIEDRAELVKFLKQFHIYVGDTWYDAPLAPARYLPKTNYQAGDCPNAEELAEHIVNLPTHRQVTTEVAQQICARIEQWQNQLSAQ